MPELPEVETTRRGVAPYLDGAVVSELIVREARLRWPIPPELPERIAGQPIRSLRRRAKYLLIGFDTGTAIVHLGMSGSLRVLTEAYPPEKHDHFDLVLASGVRLRYRDPRRFGALLWADGDGSDHPLIAALGPEPLSDAFDATHLAAALQRTRRAVKLVIMDNHVVVGVGNIYASESLFRAGVHPERPASALNADETAKLAEAIKATLAEAISAGGSTLRDFVDTEGKPGYFQLNAFVYGRNDTPCRVCGTLIRQIRIGQRTSYYCPRCQR
ncbi:bifunctional DNA-formamidopyrimidine glycosylase/DNA-(apurinic or apyrimidinic site) lyase [Jeongeupia naejangsanensis]|uniref:Formamidopyrimidine-DNA glycosylase n=1 Tax=Jeongeupia naejangsanensis TaxID=613195 RepID=A0ABS2BJT0_9NEIS|nr:bifunctional DNA-formamidopyrimidine glycosylase/DNA-(apurinic or apyrimidinic site) lyase [Jeongeupia naejangsanensis]MBM3115872.1 bifunctional DNA-formamidopyrimidine glycosylase/DNA-(apurinic or apyrimidinic site) lyase [Jeongeupia naejangsanensis]